MHRPRKIRKSEVKKHQLNAIYQDILNKKAPNNTLELHYDENGYLCYKEIDDAITLTNDNTLLTKSYK